MVQIGKRVILASLRRCGYEVLKASDPRLRPRRVDLDAALAALNDHATSEQQAGSIFDRVLQDLVVPRHQAVSWGDRLLTLDKSATFRDDPRFQEAMRDCSSSTGETQYSSPDGIAWRLNTLIWAARRALRIPGDFVECGVFEGDMSWVVTEIVDLEGAQKVFYLFDTFEGFARQYSSPADFPGAPEFFDRAHVSYSRSSLLKDVRGRFSKKRYVKVIKGIVPDILHTIAPGTIAYLHIDMNSPGPEIGALELLFDRVTPGGVVILDDYGWILHRRQKEADDRFMSARGYDILELPTGQGLLIKQSDIETRRESIRRGSFRDSVHEGKTHGGA